MKTIKFLAFAVALVGCGDDRPLDPGGSRPVDGAGGTGGNVATVAPVFARDDRFLCLDWPVCPEGVISPADHTLLREFFTWCRDMGAKVNCGPCMDTRTPACAPFVGRCKAPNWPVNEPLDYCSDRVPAPRNVVDAFTICTGDLGTTGPDGVAGSDARTVCGDDPVREPETCSARTGTYKITHSLISSTGRECTAISPVGTTTSTDIDIETSRFLVGLQCSKQVSGTSCKETTSYVCQNDDGTPPRLWTFVVDWSHDGRTGTGIARYVGTYLNPADSCELVLAISYVKL